MNGSMPRDCRAAVRVILYPWLILLLPSSLQGCGGEWVILCIAHASIDFAGIVNIVHKPNSRPEVREIPFFPIGDS